MADTDTQAQDALTDRQVAAALGFIFDRARPYYTATRQVWNLDVELRVLSAQESIDAEQVADAWDAAGAVLLERMVQTLALGVVAIDGKPVPADIEERVAWVRTWPLPLLVDCHGKWQEVVKEYATYLEPDHLKN